MFEIVRFEEDMNIFLIVRKDILSENGSFLMLPFLVYGFLRVEGSNYTDSTVAYRNISDEVSVDKLEELAESAKLIVWNID